MTTAAGVAILAGCNLLPEPPAGKTPQERAGRHVLLIAEGCGCHGQNFAGWRQGGPDRLPRSLPFGERFTGPFGSVPAPNITPDTETGIGAWGDADIAGALRAGIRPDGSRLHPIMPYHDYHGMAQEDLDALIAYLHRLRPVRNAVPKRQLSAPLPEPEPLPDGPERRPEGGVALGKYLVHHVSGCTGCHTPGQPGGGTEGMLLAGKVLGSGEVAPNITPDAETGIGGWSQADIARYLRTGTRPDGGLAQSLMAGLIVSSFRHYTPDEAEAVAAYLKSIPPVRHRPQ